MTPTILIILVLLFPISVHAKPKTNHVSKIETIVKNIGNFGVDIWDINGNFAKEDTRPPYEVVITTSRNQIESCFSAKYTLYSIMKALYTDKELKDKIARVIFSAWGYLRSSLGANDARMLTWDFGPSNYWIVTLKYKPYENERGPLNQRTWGVSNNCK